MVDLKKFYFSDNYYILLPSVVLFFFCNAALVTVHILHILYFLQAATRNLQQVIEHLELCFPAPPVHGVHGSVGCAK